MTSLVESPSAATPRRSRRSFWMNQMRIWHWVSSAVCLSGFLLFTVTGITLNHAGEIPASNTIKRLRARMPPGVSRGLKEHSGGKHALTRAAQDWLKGAFGLRGELPPAEWNGGEVYVSLPRPGGDAWVNIDLDTGDAEYERTDRGWISYLNDLHKGRHTGAAWKVFIDVLAGACLLFCVTGVALLFLHAARRPATWPAVALGLAVPIALALLFIH